MARLDGVDVEEGEGFVVFVDFVAGDFTSDNFGKDAGGHSYSITGEVLPVLISLFKQLGS